MRRIVSVIILVVLLFSMCQQKLSAEDIMEKVNEVYKDIKSFKGIAYIYIKSKNKTSTSEVKFEIVRPNKFRVEGDKFVTCSNGTVIWDYDKENETIKIYNYTGFRPEVDYGQFVENMLGNFSFKLVGTENLNERECYVIVAKPITDELKNLTVTIYVDKERYVPLKFETKFKDLISIMEYKRIDLNVPINQSEFEFPQITECV